MSSAPRRQVPCDRCGGAGSYEEWAGPYDAEDGPFCTLPCSRCGTTGSIPVGLLVTERVHRLLPEMRKLRDVLDGQPNAQGWADRALFFLEAVLDANGSAVREPKRAA